jgi:hypothetical protein
MALLLNGAGASAADPILKNLGIEWIIAASTMDIATLTDAWIDQVAGFPGTNSVKANVSPASTVLTSGTNAGYDDTTKRYTIASTTGLVVGDYIYLSHANLTAGAYQIATLPAAGQLTLVNNPLNGQGNKTGISYQVAWRWAGTAGVAPLASSGAGTQNFFKVRAADSAGNVTDASDSSFVADAPAGSSFISVAGKAYTGQSTNDATPAFSVLSGWTNSGGVSHVEFTTHSVQTIRSDFRHADGTLAEKPLATVEAAGLSLTAGDGMKYGRALLKSKSAAVVAVGVDLDINLDTTGPTIVMTLAGR